MLTMTGSGLAQNHWSLSWMTLPRVMWKKRRRSERHHLSPKRISEATSTSRRSSPRRWWSLRGAAGFLDCIVLCNCWVYCGQTLFFFQPSFSRSIDQIPLPRLDCSAAQGAKVITPIRPVMCVNQNLDLSDTAIRLMWTMDTSVWWKANRWFQFDCNKNWACWFWRMDFVSPHVGKGSTWGMAWIWQLENWKSNLTQTNSDSIFFKYLMVQLLVLRSPTWELFPKALIWDAMLVGSARRLEDWNTFD